MPGAAILAAADRARRRLRLTLGLSTIAWQALIGCFIPIDLAPSLEGFACASELDCLPQWRCDEGVCRSGARLPNGDGGIRIDAGPLGPQPLRGAALSVVCMLGETCVFDLPITNVDPAADGLLVVLEADAVQGSVTSGDGPLQVTYTAPRLGGGKDSFAYVVYDGELRSGPWPVEVDLVDKTSCWSWQTTKGSTQNGVLRLRPGAADDEPAFDAFCDLEREGGGWTLALKAFGKQPTFAYDALLWQDDQLLNPGSANLQFEEAKLAAFTRLPFNEVMVVFIGDEDDPATAKGVRVSLPFTAPSLQSVFAKDVPLRTRAGTNAWLSALAGSTLQANCNREGFNIDPQGGNGTQQAAAARIGMVANDSSDCTSPDSRIGIGLKGASCGTDDSLSVGYETKCNQAGDGEKALWGFVFVRDVPRVRFFPSSCLQALFDAETSGLTLENGQLMVDADGPGGADPFTVWCDQTLAGGGWTLVGKSEMNVVDNIGWRLDRGEPSVVAGIYSLDLVRVGLSFAEMAFGARAEGLTWGPNVYRQRALPPRWLQANNNLSLFIGKSTTLIGACELDETVNEFRFIGHTGRVDAYFFGDTENGTRGLHNQVWQTSNDTNCVITGALNQSQGMIMVR